MIRTELHNRARFLGTRQSAKRGDSTKMSLASVTSAQPIRRILVPLDGTAFGEHSLPMAMGIARRCRAQVQLVHVRTMPGPNDSPIRHYFPEVYEPSRHDRRAYLKGLANQLAEESIVAHPILIEGQSEATALARAAANVDLVVMATHARGPWGRLIHDGITHRLMREVSTPVIVVPIRGLLSPLRVGKKIGRVLIALDGTNDKEQLVDQAIAVGSVFQASFTLVRVIAHRRGYVDLHGGASIANSNSVAQESRTATDFMNQCAEPLRVRGHSVETRIVYDGRSPAEAIVELAERVGAGLIAISTQRRGALPRLLWGSTTNRVIRRTSVPVLVSCRDGRRAIHIDENCGTETSGKMGDD